MNSLLQGVFSCDWYESAGVVVWDRRSSPVFDEIERCQRQAEEHRQPVPCSLGDGQIFVHANGMGSGRSSRLEFRLEWCGVTIGLSARNEATRKLSNFYLKIPGEACLLQGSHEARTQVATWLEQWGGQLQDEWIRRLDLALDVIDLPLDRTIFPAFKAEQFLTTAHRNTFYRATDSVTGFGVGNGETVLLRVYDKLKEVQGKCNPVYSRAMVDRRWGGNVPQAAARIEYQMRGDYFRQLGLKAAMDVDVRLPDIVGRLTQTEQRPFFMLTDVVPDRKGRHQDRANILPEWASIITLLREQVGRPRQALKRLDRNLIDLKRSCSMIVGYLTSVAASSGSVVENRDDLHATLSDLLERNEVQDDQIRLKYEDKARRYGTFNDVVSFPFGGNLAI